MDIHYKQKYLFKKKNWIFITIIMEESFLYDSSTIYLIVIYLGRIML